MSSQDYSDVAHAICSLQKQAHELTSLALLPKLVNLLLEAWYARPDFNPVQFCADCGVEWGFYNTEQGMAVAAFDRPALPTLGSDELEELSYGRF